MTPAVSICIPTYCQTDFLKDTLDSVVAQNFQDYELIISDDSPNDSVKKLLESYDFSGKLVYVRNSPALGSPANWNQAARLAKGQLIKLLHHDDGFSSPTSLTEFVDLIGEDPKVGIAFSGVNTQSAQDHSSRHQHANPKDLARLTIDPMSLMLKNCIGPPSATIIRRQSFKPYRENLKWLVDVFQYGEILADTNFVATPKPLIYSTSDAEHQITHFFKNHPRLLLAEYFYFFDFFKKDHQKRASRYLNYLAELALKNDIQSASDIRQLGFEGPIPSGLDGVLGLSHNKRRLMLLVLRLKRKLHEFVS